MLIYLICTYILLSAAVGKPFSYLHLSIGGFPLYIGELFTGLALGVISKRISHLWALRADRFLILLLAYLSIGLLVTGVSLKSYHVWGLTQVLRDSAIYYYCVWAFLPIVLTETERQKIWGAIFTGICLAQFYAVLSFVFQLSPLELRYQAWAPPGNEAISPLFPISGGIFGSKIIPWVWTLCSYPIAIQLLLYIKKNWFFSVFALCLPAALGHTYFKQGREKTIHVATKTAKALTAGIFVSLFLVAVFAYMPSDNQKFQQPETFLSRIIQIFHTGVSNLGEKIHHGEATEGSLMAWRMHLWKHAWAKTLEHPLIGNGFGPPVVESVKWGDIFVNGHRISGPHNSFLTVSFRMGLGGFILIILCLLIPLISNLPRWRSLILEYASVLSLGFFALFNVCLENPQGAVFFWLILGIFVSAAKSHAHTMATATATTENKPGN